MTPARGDRVATPGLSFRPAAGLLLLLAAAAWGAVAAVGRAMGPMPGTMGLGVVAFVGAWTLMMAAMMLPGVAPFASFYTRTFTDRRERRLLALACGYLLVWAAIGLPAFVLARIVDHVVVRRTGASTALAVVVFLACGVYQLTPLKDRCLARCRSPLGFTLMYSGYRGPSRDVRAGLAHGAFCAGCCWGLMLLLLAFGLMNVGAMLAIAAAVLVEKTWRHGVGFARAVGVISIALAALVIAHPPIAAGLHAPSSTMTTESM